MNTVPLAHTELPRAAPACVLACGAFLKNTACLLEGTQAHWSPPHDDLSDPVACLALEDSVERLLELVDSRIDAIAHDLHPDFHSTRLALALAERWKVPAIAVQHHHAHIAVVQAENGWIDEPLIGLALDGVGLGSDGTSWGGEVLLVRGACFERLAHLPVLALPGGDVAAREPWRMAAAALHALGRGDEIVMRFGPLMGDALARGVHTMLARDLHCPRSSGAGRWFDAAAGALGLSLRQAHEAEAAIALEACASAWLAKHGPLSVDPQDLDLRPVIATLFDVPRDDESARGEAAARFHLALAAGLVAECRRAAERFDTRLVALGGGCFFNRVLSDAIEWGLRDAGLRVVRPRSVGVGDAGLALGQAWVAALQCGSGSFSREREKAGDEGGAHRPSPPPSPASGRGSQPER